MYNPFQTIRLNFGLHYVLNWLNLVLAVLKPQQLVDFWTRLNIYDTKERYEIQNRRKNVELSLV